MLDGSIVLQVLAVLSGIDFPNSERLHKDREKSKVNQADLICVSRCAESKCRQVQYNKQESHQNPRQRARTIGESKLSE